MYRLLRQYTLPVYNRQLSTVQNNLQRSNKVCSFCSFRHLKPVIYQLYPLPHENNCSSDYSHGTFRHQSTNTNTATVDKAIEKKIKHKIKKKYAELLEVSDQTTTNTKAKIKKLSASSISKFANQPEISLDQLHKIKQINNVTGIISSEGETELDNKQIGSKDSFFIDVQEEIAAMTQLNTNNPDKRANLPEDETSMQEDLLVLGASDQTALLKNASVLNTLQDYSQNVMDESNLDSQTNPVTASQKKEENQSKSMASANRKDKTAKIKLEELEKQGKQESLKRNLHAYLDVCVNCGMMSQAFFTLVYYRNRGKRIEVLPLVADAALFNTVLHGFASIGNLNKVKETLQIIAEDSIQPTPQTYAAVFECVGRMTLGREQKGYLESIMSEMNVHRISLNDILDKSVFVNDQREMVDQGIRILDPNFEAVYTPPDTAYTNHLLHRISTNVGQPITPAKGIFTHTELSGLGKRQMKLESEGGITVKSIAAHNKPTPAVLHYREKVIETEKMWKTVIGEAFQRDIATLKTQCTRGHHLQKLINIYPYLKVLDEHHYIEAILNEVKKLATGSETFSPSLNTLTRQLGHTIFNKYQIEMKTKYGVCEKIAEIYDEYCDLYLNGNNGNNTRATWQNLLHKTRNQGATADIEITQWPTTILISIGRFLYNIIIRDIKIDVNCMRVSNQKERYMPAFYTIFRHNRQHLTQEVKPHPILSRLYKESQLETLTFEPAMLPSISPPVPWYNIRNGGYMITDAKIIRLSYQAIQQLRRFESVPPQQLYPVLDSLNQLGSIPWKVNNPVLNIALQVFQNGGSKDLDIPEPPSEPSLVVSIDPNATKEERNKAAKARLKERRRKADMYSLWCDTLYRLSLANHYKNQVFWLPHSMDFRGRVYPIPPHVNHLGSDLARSLMTFALGKPLGPDGLDWLKIHIINLTGLKKRESNDERLRYGNEMLPKILDSAENPLTGEKWWQESEEPWQTLAACFEISEALKSPNPAEYVSKFPVHQDGSCNGLQHYAALGRDQHGAESVNLSPSACPQDVYSSIAALVEKERKIDAEKGVKIAQILEGLIKRKVIKQTVMTTVYGVTRFGARLQIARQLQEIEFPEEHLWQGSHYLVNKTFHSLREMFTSTKLIQDWFTDCARLIALVCGQNMEWVTPMGLPVVQPYHKNYQPINGSKPAQHFLMDLYSRPNVMKQKNAFPPNFIHSLDSSHMMLTSLHCEHAGLTFVSVHDCFWTHACTIPEMNKICREQFVALHSEPILQDLSEFLIKRFSYKQSELNDDGSVSELMKLKLNRILKQVPEQGAFDLNSVLDSVYFFS